MARRLDIELTSTRDDGTWTWRAAGAKKPKGELDGSLVPNGVAVGDVVKVEAEAYIDGLTVTQVFAPKTARKEPERLELLGSGREDPLVTTQLAPKGKGRGRGRGDRDGDRGRGRGRGDRGRDGDRKGRDGDRKGRGRGRDGDRDRGERQKPPARPKAPRLRPGRTHRQAALATIPDAQHALADEVLKGGVPGVRQAVDRMNVKAKADSIPTIDPAPLVALAEKMAPALKAAEWHDRADAALAGIDEIDLRDIRSVVVAADNAARDEETRSLAEKLREGLTRRVEGEHRKWLDELAQTIGDGRTVRALRLSSRPPKAGAPMPPDMAERLAASASASLTAEITQERWGTVLDAVAFSPVRAQVVPEGLPEKPNEQLLATVRKLASRVPEIAAAFGVSAPAKRKRGGRKGGRSSAPVPPPPPAGDTTPAPAAETTPAAPPAEPDAAAAAPPVEPDAPAAPPADSEAAPAAPVETPTD